MVEDKSSSIKTFLLDVNIAEKFSHYLEMALQFAKGRSNLNGNESLVINICLFPSAEYVFSTKS